jgi:hypothetical protein
MIVDEAVLGQALWRQTEVVKATGAGGLLLSPGKHDEVVGPQFVPWLETHGWKVRHVAGRSAASPCHLGLFRRVLSLSPCDRSSEDGGDRAATVYRSALPTNQMREFHAALPLLRLLRLIGEPTVLWLDRFHVADAGSVSMIRRALPILPTLPLLLVVTWQSGVTGVDVLTAELS